MRQDQFESLQARGEQLIDLFLEESDPDKWPGVGIEPAKMDKSTRGDRYWCKKDAVATLAAAQRITNLLDVVRRKTAGGETTPDAVGPDQDELDGEITEAEKLAQRMLNKVRKTAARASFNKRVHGKA